MVTVGDIERSKEQAIDGEGLGDVIDFFPRRDFLSQVPTSITSADSLVSFLVSYRGRMEAFTSCPVVGQATCSNTTVKWVILL